MLRVLIIFLYCQCQIFTKMTTYMGVNHGILSKKLYLPVIVKAWNAMVKESLRADGSLGWVQGTGKEPKDGQPVTYDSKPDFEDFGVGCFLLAGKEVYLIK